MATKKQVTKEDPNFGHVLTRSNAEIIAEHERRKATDPFYGKIQMGADAFDKKHFEEPLDDDNLYDELPIESLKREHSKDGEYSLKMMSDRITQRMGGTQGYEAVRDKDGNHVKVGNMTLGRIPAAIAKRRVARAQKRSLNEVKDIQESYNDRVAKLKSDAKGLAGQVIEPGSSVENRGGGTFDMGIHVNRGETPADH